MIKVNDINNRSEEWELLVKRDACPCCSSNKIEYVRTRSVSDIPIQHLTLPGGSCEDITSMFIRDEIIEQLYANKDTLLLSTMDEVKSKCCGSTKWGEALFTTIEPSRIGHMYNHKYI